ncbi:MAG TPA: sugar transferase [Cyanobacteria bacterium UBA11049]|nr:sugar transferase [Cyanobacteria bacterium UBA11049]
MTTYRHTIIPISPAFEQEQLDDQLLRCTLKWRQRQLLVTREHLSKQIQLPPLPSLDTEQWLVDCLKHSSVKLIRLDAALGEVNLKLWADACEKANKAVFLRLPPAIKLPKLQRHLFWKWMQLLDWSIAVLLLLVFTPVIVILFFLLRMQLSEPVLIWQWHVGNRGKLFRLFKFRTTVANAQMLENQLINEHTNILKRQENSKLTNLGYWMRKYKLDRLPQLFNVLRGEMRLIQPRPLTLEQAVRLSVEERQNISTLSVIQEA